MEYKILAADDETELLDALELYTERENIKLIKTDNGITALELFQSEKPHLVLLDIMMPGLDGFSVLKKIRAESSVPAIMITARGEDYDKILGLEIGADDYITKPYNPMVVVARIKAHLRRSYGFMDGSKSENSELRCFDIILSKKNNAAIQLTKTEFMILSLLMKNQGRIFTKQQIFDYARDSEYIADDNTIMVHISNLRSKIEDNPKKPTIIKTIKGLGYKIEKG